MFVCYFMLNFFITFTLISFLFLHIYILAIDKLNKTILAHNNTGNINR
jgi:hypothetical protein